MDFLLGFKAAGMKLTSDVCLVLSVGASPAVIHVSHGVLQGQRSFCPFCYSDFTTVLKIL
jgi:hypothetical protein